mmetsp:Transcript_33009/g.32366  ORF Transcript_33009/g.32366 Transcript_33009/m.32366 type:complete len:100 (+) Transcript_33009:470-769(+)
MKFIEIYKHNLQQVNALKSDRSDARLKEKTNDYDNNYIKTTYGIKFLKEKAENDLIPTDCSNKNNSAREYLKQRCQKAQDSDSEPVELPQIMASSPYHK